jgi:hypothetical protein
MEYPLKTETILAQIHALPVNPQETEGSIKFLIKDLSTHQQVRDCLYHIKVRRRHIKVYEELDVYTKWLKTDGARISPSQVIRKTQQLNDTAATIEFYNQEIAKNLELLKALEMFRILLEWHQNNLEKTMNALEKELAKA